MANQRFLTTRVTHLHLRIPSFILIILGAIFSVLILGGCTGAAKFRVLDANTKKPIDGAVALATWTKNKGLPGLNISYTAKAIEAVSDHDGFFVIPGTLGTLSFQTPHLKVYKPGYVGWDSRWIYLGCRKNDPIRSITEKRKSFSMKDQDIYLQPWHEEYSFTSHRGFINPPADIEKGGIDDSKYFKAIEHEVPFYLKEDRALREKRK